METTIDLDDELLEEAKRFAAENNQSLAAVIEEALREKLARHRGLKEHKRFKLVTFRGNGLQPGVDLDNNAALLDLMEGIE